MSRSWLLSRSCAPTPRHDRDGEVGRASKAAALLVIAGLALLASCSQGAPPPPSTADSIALSPAAPAAADDPVPEPPPPLPKPDSTRPPPPSRGPTAAPAPPAQPPTFSLPAPTASSWLELPPGICANGTLDTLGVVADTLRRAIARAGVTPFSFYVLAAPDSGFVMVTRLEHTLADGRPAPAGSRFPTDSLSAGEVEPTPWSWVLSLVSATPGYYRTVLFVVTPSTVRMAGQGLTQAEADSILGHGAAGLSRVQASTTLRGVRCTALIYEIEKRNAVDPAHVLTPGRLQPDAHLIAAGYWSRSDLVRP